MQTGMPGVNSPIAQGMHPAMAQQMVMKKIPEPEDPTIGESTPVYSYLHLADCGCCYLRSGDGRAERKGYCSRSLSKTAWLDE